MGFITGNFTEYPRGYSPQESKDKLSELIIACIKQDNDQVVYLVETNKVNVNFIKYGVIDLINGKTIAEVPLYMRMKYLRTFLDELMKDLDIISNATIVIEKQPGINTITPGIEAALYLYYAYAKEVINLSLD